MDYSATSGPPPQPRDMNPQSGSKLKRRKIQIACRHCRNSKTRCDGNKPVCSACVRRGLTASCLYERAQASAKSHAIDRDPQVQRPEPVQNANRLSFPEEFERGSDNVPPHSNHNILAAKSMLPVPSPNSRSINHNWPVENPDPYQVDALATVNSFGDNDCLYGGSSTIAFVHHIADNGHAGLDSSPIPVQGDRPSQNLASLDPRSISPAPEMLVDCDERAYVYPARRKADDFMYCFWEFIHPVFPVIHKTSFVAKYKRLWIAEDNEAHVGSRTDLEEVVFTSNLNLIFALGCQFSNLIPDPQKRSAANEFYQRSRRLFVFDILDSKSTSFVQMLLLMAIYLQSTSHASRCWNSIGLAIRLAQSLGLHSDYAGRRPETQLACQMRRRIWHVCIILDKLSAMTFGRPTMISSPSHVPVPLLIDDEYLLVEGEGEQPPDVPSRLGLFVSSCKLFEILHEILYNFYGEESGNGLLEQFKSDSRARDILVEVLDYNRRLDRFSNTIPEYLQTNESSGIVFSQKNSCINLQQQVLFCRFLYTRLLSLRPILLLATRRSTRNSPQSSTTETFSSSLDEELIKSCCKACVTTAHSLVETIHLHLDTAYKSTGWHSVYCNIFLKFLTTNALRFAYSGSVTFAAASIVLAALKCNEIDPEIHQTSFETCWNQCLSILDHYKKQIHSVPRVIQVLQALRSHVMTTLSPNMQLRIASVYPPQEAFDSSLHIDFSNINPNNADSISDAWFGQNIFNLDWLDVSVTV